MAIGTYSIKIIGLEISAALKLDFYIGSYFYNINITVIIMHPITVVWVKSIWSFQV